MPDIVLCFVLSPVEAAGEVAFGRAFVNLIEHNPGLLHQTSALQIVSSGKKSVERAEVARSHVASYLQNKGGADVPPLYVFDGHTMGRCLNDAFLWAIASAGDAYWLVWDDMHLCVRPFMRSARNVLQEGPLSQLMLEGTWASELPSYRKVEADGFRYILPRYKDSSTTSFLNHAAVETWPGFTLSPAWHRLAFLREAVQQGHLSLKPFPESSFETWETLLRVFGNAWLEAGSINGALIPSPAAYVDPKFMEDSACPV